MKISARNILVGTVSKVTKGCSQFEVDLTLTGGDKIAAIITTKRGHSWLERRQEGCASQASWVILGKIWTLRRSATQCVEGNGNEVQKRVNTEVQLKLSGGAELTAINHEGELHTLGLKAGEQASAAFKASSVIVGVE